MNTTSIERLKTERKLIRKNRGYCFYALPIEEKNKINLHIWECGFPGIGMYEKGYFKLKLFFKTTYPFTPPVAQFTSPVYHPNIYSNNTVCIDLLATKWKPGLSITNILYALQQLLLTPNPLSPANPIANSMYLKNKKEFAKKVTDCIVKYHSSFRFEYED